MSASTTTTVEALRAALVQTVVCSPEELRTAVGEVVVATVADLSDSAAPGLGDCSLYDPETRTTVILADRIPAGQEARCVAAEITRWSGVAAAKIAFGERVDELLSGSSVSGNQGAKSLIFDDDGTIKGLRYRPATDRRGAVLAIQLGTQGKPGFLATMLVVDGKDFRQVFEKAVSIAAGYYQLPEDSELRGQMVGTCDSYLKKYALRLVEVRYEVAVPINAPANVEAIAIAGREKVSHYLPN